jgi:hypothetical protein
MLGLDLLAISAVAVAAVWRALPAVRRRFAGGGRLSPLDELEGAFR